MFKVQINLRNSIYPLLRTWIFFLEKYHSLIFRQKYHNILLIHKYLHSMRLLGKSRKKYHGSIIIDCRSIIIDSRSIIKDSTMHEKRLLKHQEKSV